MTQDEHNPEGTDHAAQGHYLAASKTPPPAPALPQEVREAIATIYAAPYNDLQASDRLLVDLICAAIAPLWPRPAPVTAPRIEDNPIHRYVSDPHNDGSCELRLGPARTQKLWDEIDALLLELAVVKAVARKQEDSR